MEEERKEQIKKQAKALQSLEDAEEFKKVVIQLLDEEDAHVSVAIEVPQDSTALRDLVTDSPLARHLQKGIVAGVFGGGFSPVVVRTLTKELRLKVLGLMLEDADQAITEAQKILGDR